MGFFQKLLIILGLLLSVACGGGNPVQQPNPPVVPPAPVPTAPAVNPVPFFDTLLTPEQTNQRSEKYRALFTNERVLRAISFPQEGSFPAWPDDLKRTFLNMIIVYEDNQGQSLPPMNVNCSLDGQVNPCYQMRNIPRPNLELTADYARYVQMTQMAWHLYVEANHLVPWSILNYSQENLNILFDTSFTQPRLGRQFYMANLDILESYRIVTGLLRAPGDSANNLVGANALETMLNVTQFLGERLTHERGTSDNNLGPGSNIWPYRTRDNLGNLLRDNQGDFIPLNRLPTPREVLVYFDPHHDLEIHPEALVGPQYHIINGCWGASALVKELMSAINLPVIMIGDYINFGSHSGAQFAEIEGNTYFMSHSDNLYFYEWAYRLITLKDPLQGRELWGFDGFSPFREMLAGYSVFHTNRTNIQFNAITLESLGFGVEQIARLRQEFSNNFGGPSDYDLRVLAVRAISNPPPVQNLFAKCEEVPFTSRRHLPLTYLTELEAILYERALGIEILRRRNANPQNGANLSCFELFHDEMNDIYKKKTGVELRGDEDQDGFENYRDCNLYQPDQQACEGAFQRSIGIVILG